jgi:hypothetical protein
MVISNIEMDFMIEDMYAWIYLTKRTCHELSSCIYSRLKERGYDVKLKTGMFVKNNREQIRHSWIEYKNFILETNPQQLGLVAPSQEGGCIVKDEQTIRKYIVIQKCQKRQSCRN